jgi:hypothetical protein
VEDRAGWVGEQGWAREAIEPKYGNVEYGEIGHGTQGIRHTHGLCRGMEV